MTERETFVVEKERNRGEWSRAFSTRKGEKGNMIFEVTGFELLDDWEFDSYEEAKKKFDQLTAGRGKTYVDRIFLKEKMESGWDVSYTKTPETGDDEEIWF